MLIFIKWDEILYMVVGFKYEKRGQLASNYSSAVHRNNLGLYSVLFKISRSGIVPFQSGSPGEFHPQAPTDPYVNLSIHTAPLIQSISTIDFTLVKSSSHLWLTKS